MIDVNRVWTEKYRPTKLDDIILSDKNRSILKTFIDNDEIPNLLFCGHAGIGKTTTAKALINHLDAEFIYQNCSEVGIDTVRNDITGFSRTKSFNGKKKIVLLDEIDGIASIDAQRSLRNVLEEYAGHCRFILTCNYKHRVIIPLQSRCQSLDLDPNITDVAKRCLYILKQENISVDDDSKRKLVGLLRKYFPDIRKSINEMQKFCIDGKLSIPELNIANDFIGKVISLVLSKKTLQGRKLIIENEAVFNGDYPVLMKNLFDEVCTGNYNLTDNQKRLWLVAIGEYMYRSTLVLDQEINFYCLLLTLSDLNG
jgi:hypothetical protein